MLFFPQLYCTVSKVFPHLFDNDKSKPCMGLCGHTICLKCIDNNPEIACPECQIKGAFVNRTPNYIAIEIIEDYRENSWEMFKKWWMYEDSGEGECSKCSRKEDHLRICLTCDSDHTCQLDISMMRLKMRWLEDLQTLSKNALCEECASKFHANNGHKTMRIDSINFAMNDIQRETAHTLMTLIRAGFRQKKKLMNCRMRKQNLKTIEISLDHKIMNLREREGKCGQLGYLMKKELVKKYIENFDSLETELSENANLKCECSRLYEKLESQGTNFYNKFYKICLRGLSIPGCPLYSWRNEKQRLELYSIVNEIPEFYIPIDTVNKDCPLCIFMDHEQYQNQSNYQQDWISIFENIWNSELPPLKTYCIRCLEFCLKVGAYCKKCEAIEEEVFHEHFLCVFYKSSAQPSDNMESDCVLKKPKCWKYAIIYKLRRKIRRIMTDEIENTPNFCALRKMRMMNTMHRLHYKLGEIDLKRKTENDLLRRIDQVEKYLKSLRFQWKSYIIEAEKQITKCICTAPMKYLEKTVNYLWETDHKKLESYRRLQLELEFLAYKSLTKKKVGCPLRFSLPKKHQFSDAITVRQFFSEFVSIFCADNRSLIDSFYMKPHDVDYDISEFFQNLFGLE